MRKEVIAYEDDLDDQPIDPADHHLCRFMLDGTEYELDLRTANRDALHAAVAPFLKVARKAGTNAAKAKKAATPKRHRILHAVPSRVEKLPPPPPPPPAHWDLSLKFHCTWPGCTWPGTNFPQGFAAHKRLAGHQEGGGASAKEMIAKNHAQREAKKAAAAKAAAARVAAKPAPPVNDVTAVVEQLVKAAPPATPEVKAKMAKALAPAPAKAKPTPAPPKHEPVTQDQLAALFEARQGAARHVIEPGVNYNPVMARDLNQGTTALALSPAVAPDAKAKFDWGSLPELDSSVLEIRERYRHGLPEVVQFTYHPDVLAVEGMDFVLVESALRHPERVEVAPETFVKGYPILRFSKGDCLTVLGCRTPARPKIIAAYHLGLALHDWHRVNHTGGGGSRALTGLPKTPKDSINRLRTRGAKVEEWDDLGNATATAVSYQGQDLGKISVGLNVKRDQVESDYQRTLRKIEAIDNRAGAKR